MSTGGELKPGIESAGPNWGELGLKFFRQAEEKQAQRDPSDKSMLFIAEVLFQRLKEIGCIEDSGKNGFFTEFSAGLYDINPEKNPNFDRDFAAFWQKYGETVERLALWSQGDTQHSAYQVIKLFKAGLFREVAGLVKAKFDTIIQEDKFTPLEKYLKDHNTRKVVVIDDEPANLERVQKIIGESGLKVELTTIWAAYSRRAEKYKKEHPDKFDVLFNSPTTIKSFAELSQRQDFSEIFKDSVVLLDVDGPILNNGNAGQKVGALIYKLAEDYISSKVGDNQQEVSNKLKQVLNIN